MRMQKRLGLFCAGAACVLAAACAKAPAPESTGKTSADLSAPNTPTINTFVVYAANNVTLGAGDHSLGGDIGVGTTAGASPQLTVGSGDLLDNLHTLFAPSISVGNLAIAGPVDTNALTNNGGQVGTQSSYPASMPPLPAVFARTPGTTNVTVAQGQQQTLSPGPYGALTDNGIVFLNPGTYSFSSVTLGNSAQLQALQGGSTSVLIAGTLSTGGTPAQIFPAGQLANALTISVSGNDGPSGPAVSIGANSLVIALLAAPNGTVSLGNNVQATGAFAGVNFVAGTNVQMNFQSGFPNSSPTISTFVAYAELSITLGTGDHSLGGDIGVAATGAPNVGTQLNVGSQTQLDAQHTLYAPSVSLGSQAVVGDVEATTLTNSGGSFGTQAPYPASAMPLLPLALASTPNTTNVSVAQGQHATLSPGPYGTLTDNGIVFLNPGTYSFSSVTLGNNAQLQALQGGSTSVLIEGTLSTGGTPAQIFPAGQLANALTISVSGSDGPSGPAVSIGANSQVIALLAAPNGTVSLGNNVQATGAFAAFNITAGNNVALTFQSGMPPTSATGSQPARGYVPPPCSLAGVVPQSTPINLAMFLPVTNPQGLQAFVNSVSDPTNPLYGTYIGASAFAAAYSDPSAYSMLRTWARTAGLSVVSYPNNLLIDVGGTAGLVEQAFNVNLRYCFRADGTQFYEPDRIPSVTGVPPVVGIDGLDNFLLPQPAGGTAPFRGLYQSSDIRNAYVSCALNLTGAGQSVGLVEFDGFNPSDITNYIASTNLADASPLPPMPVEVLLNGIDAGGLTVTDGGDAGPIFNGEATGDVDVLMGMAPGAQIVFFEGKSINSILSAIATYDAGGAGVPPLNQLSSSWFGGNNSACINDAADGGLLFGCPNTSQFVSEIVANGQSYFQAAGDFGAYQPPDAGCSPDASAQAPAAPTDIRALPGLTLVGGTALTMSDGGAAYVSETTWSQGAGGTGAGGQLPSEVTPDYQLNLIQQNLASGQASSTVRNAPDVSVVATSLFSFVNGKKSSFAGTSAAAPEWAGFMALANQQRQMQSPSLPSVGFANQTLYTLATFPGYSSQYFNDIQDNSSNTNTCGFGYTAVMGYDLATGLGSPRCGLISELSAIGQQKPAVTVVLSTVSLCTSGGNLFNCLSPSCNSQSITDIIIPCNPTPNPDGSISQSIVTVPPQQYGCGNGHGAVVQVTCQGTGQVGNIGLSGSVALSVSDQCGTNQIDPCNVSTFTFADLLPGAAQFPNCFGAACNPFPYLSSTSPLGIESCSNPGSTCSPSGCPPSGQDQEQSCPFNNFQALLTVENTGGF